MKKLRHDPVFFCLCGPTGCGKTTITKRLAALDPNLRLSVSATTRPARLGEIEGREYRFIDHLEFQNRIDAGQFVEFAEVSGHLYGTERLNFSQCAEAGTDLLLDIDYQGTEILRAEYGEQVVVIFVFPPSFQDLEARVIQRHEKDSPERIQARMTLAEREIEILSSVGFSEYLLINDFLDAAVERAYAIIKAEQMRMSRYPKNLVREITKKI